MPSTIEDKIFGKASFDPGFAKSLRHCGEVTRLGGALWEKSGPRVVISHNAPVINPNSKYKGGPLTPFNSLDMVEIIETHQPALWVYGHTHECDDQMIGQTQIISNQLGYPGNLGGFECKDFDGAALPVERRLAPSGKRKSPGEGKRHAVLVLLFLLIALREPLSDHHAQMPMPCGRSRLWRDHVVRLRRAT